MQGKLIVIEGADISGKATQAKLLANRLRKTGKTVEAISIPRYEGFFGKIIENGWRVDEENNECDKVQNSR